MIEKTWSDMLDKRTETFYFPLRPPEGYLLSDMKTSIAILSLIFVSTLAAVGNTLPPCDNSLPPCENTLPPSDN